MFESYFVEDREHAEVEMLNRELRRLRRGLGDRPIEDGALVAALRRHASVAAERGLLSDEAMRVHAELAASVPGFAAASRAMTALAAALKHELISEAERRDLERMAGVHSSSPR